MKYSSGVCLCRVAVAAVAAPLCEPIVPHSNRCAALKFWGSDRGPTEEQREGAGQRDFTRPSRVNAAPGIHGRRESSGPVVLRRSSRTVRKVLQGASANGSC